MKKFVIALVVLLLVGVVAFWYFHRDNDKARDVLPEDATAAMVFEPAELVSELGLNLKDILRLASIWGDAEGTIDFKKPVYGFTTENGVSGFALNVEDAEKLLKLVNSFGFDSEEQDGLQWIANKDYLGCIDKDKMLVINALASQQDELRDEMVKLMKQKRQDVPTLDKAKKQKGVFHSSTALSNIPKQYAASLPADIDLSKTFFNSGLRIEKKAFVYAANVEGVDNLSVPLSPIKGDFFGNGQEEPFAWICVNMKGEELLPYLRKVDQLRTALLALNMCVDADLMIKAIDGDVMLAMPKLDLTTPNIIFTATLNNTDFLKNAGNWEQVSKRGTNDFVMSQDGFDVFFGVRNGKLYISNSEELANNACKEGSASGFQSAAKGKYMSASINAGQVIQAVSKGLSSTALVLNIPQVREMVNAVDRVSINADTKQSVEFSIETNKPVKDIYKNLISLLTGK